MDTRTTRVPSPRRYQVLGLACVLLLAGCSSTVAGQAIRPVGPVPSATVSAGPPAGPSTPAGPTGQSPPHSGSPSVAGGTGAPATTRPSRPSPQTLGEMRTANDVVIDRLLGTLGADLVSGRQSAFLAPFVASLTHRVANWYANTRALGVDGTRFVRMQGYYTEPDDTPSLFTRTIVLGIRTPYDDQDSAPGITYSVQVRKTGAGWRITIWKPTYVEDPMFCDCTLSVTRSGSVAVIDSGSPHFDGWPAIVLAKAKESVAWTASRMAGSGLATPRGEVFFLADAPYHWFLNTKRPAEQSNATIMLVDATGSYPGEGYSHESRIVITLVDADGNMAPQNEFGSLYVWDVITHETTHHLMTTNSRLHTNAEQSIDTWMVEGIAVAVEILHRHAHPETEDVGYPLPDDPQNIDPEWLAAHATGALPSRTELYDSTSLVVRNNWYAIAGSVFLYLDKAYDFSTMMSVARQVYSSGGASPFGDFPDPDHPGQQLTETVAKSRWVQWLKDTYLS